MIRSLLSFLGTAALLCSPPAFAQTTATEVPLEWVDGFLVVPVSGGEAGVARFAISTGAARTVLTESGASRLGRQPVLELGGHAISTDDLSVVPDERLRAGSTVLDGMIGASTLSDFDLLVDVPGARLVLQSFGRSVSFDGVRLSDPVRLNVMHGVALLFDIELEGRSYPAMLDLGSPATVVSEGVVSDLGLDGEETRALRLGAMTVPELAVQHRALEVFEMWAPNGEGVVVLGTGFLRECPVAISYVHAELRTCVP